MVRSAVISAAVGAVTALVVFLALCLLTGCIPGGLSFQGPGVAVDAAHSPDKVRPGNCVFEGQVIMSEGTSLQCGGVPESADPAGMQETPDSGQPEASAAAEPGAIPADPPPQSPPAMQDAHTGAPDSTPRQGAHPPSAAGVLTDAPVPPGAPATAGPDLAQLEDPAQPAALAQEDSPPLPAA